MILTFKEGYFFMQIMLRFRKELTTRIISILIVISFLFSNSAYSSPPNLPDKLRLSPGTPKTERRQLEVLRQAFLDAYNFKRWVPEEEALKRLDTDTPEVQQISSLPPGVTLSIEEARRLVEQGEASIVEREDKSIAIVFASPLKGHLASGDRGSVDGVTYYDPERDMFVPVSFTPRAPVFDFAFVYDLIAMYREGTLVPELEGKIAAAVQGVKELLGEVEGVEPMSIQGLIERVKRGSISALAALEIRSEREGWIFFRKTPTSMTDVRVDDIHNGLSMTMEAIRDMYSTNRYGEPPIEIREELSVEEYKQLIGSLVKLSWDARDNKDFLLELITVGELLDMALLLSQTRDSEGNNLWANLDVFFNATLNLSQQIPRGKLLSKGAFDIFSDEEVPSIFRDSHERSYNFLRELIISKTDLTDSEFSDMTEIGFSSVQPRSKFLFQYTRLAEVASIVKEGFGRPVRFERNLDTQREGLSEYPVLGIHYRMGAIQMYVLAEIRKREDLAGVLSQFCEIKHDSTVDRDIVVVSSGLFYDKAGNLTLAEFKAPLRVHYSVFHLKDRRLTEVRDTGIPVPFSPELAPVSSDKSLYLEFFADSGLPIPFQVTWPLEKTRELGTEQALKEVKQLLIQFAAKDHHLESVFIKPAKGSKGENAKPFKLRANPWVRFYEQQEESPLEYNEQQELLQRAAEHIVYLGDDAIIQSNIEKYNFRFLIQDSIRLGHLEGTVDFVLRQIFGRRVKHDAEIDWVIRNIISRDDAGNPVVLARRIIVNDKGVANTGQGGVMIAIEDYAPQLLEKIDDFDDVNIAATAFGTSYGEIHHAGVTEPLDGVSPHNTEIVLIDNIITLGGDEGTDLEPVIIEVDYGFVSNMWRVDERRAEWTEFVLDRVVKRMNAYRQALASDRYAYDAKEVNTVIARHREDLHSFRAQSEIFEAVQASYDPDRDEEIIEERIQQARMRGEEIVTGIGGLGIAGIGPSILQAAAQRITDVRAIRAKVGGFYSAYSKDMPPEIADALWQLHVLTQEDTLSVAQISGALTRLQEAEDLVGAMQSASNRAKLKRDQRAEAQAKLNELLALIDDFREDVVDLIDEAPKKNIFSVFAVQPLNRPPGHGYFVGLVNDAVFPHGINDGGLKAIMPDAHPRLYASPSRKAVEHADTIIVTIRLDVEPAAPGKYQIVFGPLMKEMEDFAKPLALGIENAKREGRRPPTVIIVTTQGPGTSRMLIDALEQALKKVSGTDYKCGEDFYFVHAPSNIDPGKNWVNSLTKTPQPISGVNKASIEAGVRFFSSYGQRQRIYTGPQSLEQVEAFKVLRNVVSANSIANATMTAHAASLVGASFPALRAHIHDVAGVGQVRKLGGIPSHHLPYVAAGVGGPCLYKESEIIQALGLMGTDVFGHTSGPFTEFLLEAVDTSIVTFMRASRQVNELQPYYVSALIFAALEKAGISSEEAKVVLAGIAYKRDMGGDTRHTPAFDIILGLLADPLHLRNMPANFEATYPYLESHGIPDITMVDPDVSYFREIDQRANKVPEISTLVDQDDSVIRKIPALAAEAKVFLIEHKSQLSSVNDLESLRALDPEADPILINYIADFFFLTPRGQMLRNAWEKLANSEIQQDLWKAVEGKSILVLAQGHKVFKTCINDLPRLANLMEHRIIVDAVNFMNDEEIKQWQALGGIYFGVGKANPYIDFLQQIVETQSQTATRLLKAKREGDLFTIRQILDSIREEMTLDVILNLRGSLSEREIALRLHHGIPPQDLDWDTWYYFGGGKYLLIGAEQGFIKETKRVFSAEKAALKEELIAQVTNAPDGTLFELNGNSIERELAVHLIGRDWVRRTSLERFSFGLNERIGTVVAYKAGFVIENAVVFKKEVDGLPDDREIYIIVGPEDDRTTLESVLDGVRLTPERRIYIAVVKTEDGSAGQWTRLLDGRNSIDFGNIPAPITMLTQNMAVLKALATAK